MQPKWSNLGFLALAELLAMSLWFSASAVVSQLADEWQLSAAEQAWLTMSVQIGFVVGALLSAILNLADRIPSARLFASAASIAALANVAIPVLNVSFGPALCLRFITGFCLAGVYPPGMKLAATWTLRDRGLGIGILVGALTLGSGLPHLIKAVSPALESGIPAWRSVLLWASVLAAIGGMIVLTLVREGPHSARARSFSWRHAGHAFSDRPLRLANFGYLGHMWELYAMWTWVPICLVESYRAAGLATHLAFLAGFAVLAVGALGCVLAGVLADRIGRCAITIASLTVSGLCCLVAGLFFAQPGLLTAVCLIWGFAVVADSAQFSAAISELADPGHTGTALTMQTSLGFLLTLFTIQIIPVMQESMSWRWVFSILALGPLLGIISMWRLRGLPEASRMASGKR